jgi:hypothetical protein
MATSIPSGISNTPPLELSSCSTQNFSTQPIKFVLQKINSPAIRPEPIFFTARIEEENRCRIFLHLEVMKKLFYQS